MNTCKVVGIGCLGRAGAFQRIWQEVVPVLAGKNIDSELRTEHLQDAVKSASVYVGRDQSVTVNLSVYGRLKTETPSRERKPILRVIPCS